jgi:DNA repair exonuclease SbcCD nuclease subunit
MQRAFSRVIQICRKEKPVFLLVAGDFFDSPFPPESFLSLARDSFESLIETNVMISPGNHDPATVGSCWLADGYWPENVYIFKGQLEKLTYPGLKTHVWGAGFAESYQDSPLLGTSASNEDDFINLCVMHGDLTTGASTYNPISEDMISKSNMDYMALGHIHRRTKILRAGRTFYSYPGSPEGLGFDEQSQRGVYVGEVGKGICNLQFYPVNQREYCLLELDVTGLSQSEIVSAIRTKISGYARLEENLYSIELVGDIDEDRILSPESIASFFTDVFYIKVKDRTRIVSKASSEQSLKAVFVRKMQERIAKSPDDETLRLALKLGLSALKGKAGIKA